MIVHVMLIDKQIAGTLPAIHFLDRATPWASAVVVAGVGVYLWECVFPGRAVNKKVLSGSDMENGFPGR